jgi:hypothetical protein
MSAMMHKLHKQECAEGSKQERLALLPLQLPWQYGPLDVYTR